MTTFGWKRKAGENVSKDVLSKFEANAETGPSVDDEWLQRFKRRRSAEAENRKLKSEELKAEGVRLAQLKRLREAVVEFDKALSLVPDEKTLEMKAQALLELDNPFPAVQSAEKATHLNPRFWEAFQTLGRAQLGIGDLQMAKISFLKAIHLNPAEQELREDLQWTLSLLQEKEKLASEAKTNEESCKPYAI